LRCLLGPFASLVGKELVSERARYHEGDNDRWFVLHRNMLVVRCAVDVKMRLDVIYTVILVRT
jgi:hypothetical protein